MSNGVMPGNKGKSKVFEMLLSSPGMSENCKVVFMLSRQSIIFLSRVIEVALLTDGKELEDEILSVISEDALMQLRVVQEEILKKGDLAEFYQKIKSL